MVDTTSSTAEETPSLSERDFEDITNNLENRMSKRLKDTEQCQRDILRQIENLSSKVDNSSNFSLEQDCSNSRIDMQGGFSDEPVIGTEALNETKNANLSITC